MEDFRLYVIVDKKVCGQQDLLELAHQAILGGADIIQLRDKEGSTKELIKAGEALKILAHREGARFIVNDRADVAKAVDADGVHLGQGDIPINVARSIIGKNKIVGISTHNLPQAVQAEKDGADYISIGPIFATSSKPTYSPAGLEIIREIEKNIHIPFVAIGGIGQTNIKAALEAGARRVAVTRAVLCAKDIAKSAKELKEKICK